MSRTHHTPELLAPVGSPEALIAAVRCGADAVYLGAGRFHARQHTQPFDDAALADAVAYCHARGVAVHMTLNTLVHEREMNEALDTAAKAATLDIDALIVQDRGLAAAIRRAAPDLPLHASTQLSCHTPAGVKRLAAEGFSRVVLAREMTADEIASCIGHGVEIETFVHGALCMSVSGQCLLSAMLGGRSGNRGECAQPCRLPFSVTDNRRDTCLSLKDNSLVKHIPALAAMGVDSLKIEGRMKRPEYVAAAVTVCRAMLDGREPDAALLDDLRAVFSRSGFTDGYFVGRRDKTMFGVRTKDDVTAAPAANKRLATLYAKETPRVPIGLTFTMCQNTPLTLTVSDRDGHVASSHGDIPRQSERPLSEDRLREALGKLGGTPFYAEHIAVEQDDGADAPLSAINALRREAVAALTAMREAPVPYAFEASPMKELPAVEIPDSPAVAVRLSTAAQWSEALSRLAALTVVPLSTLPQTVAAMAAHGRVAVEVPRGMFASEETIASKLRAAAEHGAVAAVAHNVGALPLCEQAGLPVIGGFGLYTANRETLTRHATDGLCAATLSPELKLPQAWSAPSPLPLGAIAYGRLPLMLLRNCPAKAVLGCRDCHQHRRLTDRKGAAFPLMCENGCADLLNSVPLYTADIPHIWRGLSFVTLYMTDESAERVAAVTSWYASGCAPDAQVAFPDGFTRGMKSI